MSTFSRRHFISGVSAATIAAAVAQPWQRLTAQEAAKTALRKPLPKAKIGKTGIETTILGLGTGTHGGNDFINLGQTNFVDLLMHGVQNGIRYLDTAENYRTHIFMRFLLQEAKKIGVNREDFFLLTKSFARTAGAAKAIVARYLYEMECGYLDALLMHCLTERDWPTRYREVLDVLVEERDKQGSRVKNIGVSVHSLDALEACVDVDELDVVLVRINPFGVNMDASPDKVVPVVKKLHEKGKGILGMKIFGEGKLEESQQRYDSLKFAMELDCVNTMTIGFTKKSQIDETLDMISEIQG